jgi:tetratricopeptide (TPR) repeat protein
MGEDGCGARAGREPRSLARAVPLLALAALALLGACRSTPDSRAAVEAAEAATRTEDWPRAAELWTEVHVSSGGTDRRAYLESARALHEAGDPTSACGMLRQGLAVFPDDAELLALHGRVLRQCGFRRAAEDTYARAVEVDPQNADALLALAELRLDLGLEHTAIAPLERLVELTGGDAHTLSLLGRVQAVEGDPVAAWRSFERAIELGADDVPTLVQAGHLSTLPRVRSEEPGALEEGEGWLERAVALDPQATRAHFLLGLTQEELGRLVEALASYRRAVETDPGCVEALTNLAVLYARIGDAGGTSEMVARALRIEGDPARRAALMDLLR